MKHGLKSIEKKKKQHEQKPKKKTMSFCLTRFLKEKGVVKTSRLLSAITSVTLESLSLSLEREREREREGGERERERERKKERK